MSTAITALASALGIVASGYGAVWFWHWAERRTLRKEVEQMERARRAL